jgi:hypothetical protein
MPIFYVTVFKDMLWNQQKKSNDSVNSALNSIIWSIQFTITTEMKQPQQVLD